MVLSMNSMIYSHTTKEAKHKQWEFFADKAIISVKPFNLHSFSLKKKEIQAKSTTETNKKYLKFTKFL